MALQGLVGRYPQGWFVRGLPVKTPTRKDAPVDNADCTHAPINA